MQTAIRYRFSRDSPQESENYEVKNMTFNLGELSNSSGSCFIELSGTKVCCVVRGPHATVGKQAHFSDKGVLSVQLTIPPFASNLRQFTPEQQNLLSQVSFIIQLTSNFFYP